MQLKQATSSSIVSGLFLIAPFALWGTAMVFMKGAMPHTTPLFLASVRLIPAGVLVLIAAACLGRPQPKTWQAWSWIVLFSVIDGALFQGFLATGLDRTGAGLGSVMIDSQPLAVALMALWFFGEHIGVWGWLGLAVGVLGISLIGFPDAWILSAWQALQQGLSLSSFGSITDALDWQTLVSRLFQTGEWLMLLAALSMAVGTIILRAVCRYADPVVATGWHMIIGGLPLAIASGVCETNQWSALQPLDWMAMGYSTVFGSAIAYALFFYFAASGSLTSLSSLTFLTPVFALLFGHWLLDEHLSLIQSFGVGLTLVSIYLVNQRDRLQMPSLWVSLAKLLKFQQPSIVPTRLNKTTDVELVQAVRVQRESDPVI
jgi:drug/metabolite transporter (DMT)-like permease